MDAISSERLVNRLKVFSRVIKGEPIIVVAHIEALLNKIMNPDIYGSHFICIDKEDTINVDDLTNKFIQCGYEREHMVEAVGQFSIRGGIIDFFPPSSQNPYRIELFGDEIDSIRIFDIESQRSLELVDQAYISPVKEVLILDEYREAIIENLNLDLKNATKN